MASTNRLRQSPIPGHLPNGEILEPAPATPPCPLCASLQTEAAFTDNGCTLRVCNICDLFFVDPYPPGKHQHHQVSSGSSQEIQILDCVRRHQGERLFYDRHFGLIAEECQGASSFLDVGCGTGNLLARLEARPGLYRAGIELNSQAARFARKVTGRTIWEIPFEEFRSDRKFDVITLINVFSHIPSFDGLFESLRAAIRPGGKIILRTSEMARTVSRWNQVHWGIPDDLHFLGLGTLEYLCVKYGFAVARHIRTPFEEELFRRSRWEQMGRSRFRNGFKKAALRIPLALPAMKKLYTALLGQRLFVSFIVLMPLPSGRNARLPRVSTLRADRVRYQANG
ncbi:MAG: class I SAM-dependent methyltransferase [Candidatus Acidiferrales bacterium]